MLNLDRKEECVGCAACATSCGNGAIRMVADDEGFLYPAVDRDVCVGCGRCIQVHNEMCRASAYAQCAYAAYSLDEQAQVAASSGGLFAEMAYEVLAEGGVVVGAAFDASMRLRHALVEDAAGVEALCGSKYVQSELDPLLLERVGLRLVAGELVLFVGTPCQVAGLKAFLGRDFASLITVELICHGAPSPLAFRAYVDELEDAAGSRVNRFSFREKREPYYWADYRCSAVFEDGAEESWSFRDTDVYGRAFQADVMLRPSCYECAFKGRNRCADITLGDFWGLEKVLPRFFDIKGISLVLINSDRGAEFFARLSGRVCAEQVDVEDAMRDNAGALRCPNRPAAREAFLASISSGGGSFSDAAARFAGDSRLKMVAKRLVRRIRDERKRMLSRRNGFSRRRD